MDIFISGAAYLNGDATTSIESVAGATCPKGNAATTIPYGAGVACLKGNAYSSIPSVAGATVVNGDANSSIPSSSIPSVAGAAFPKGNAASTSSSGSSFCTSSSDSYSSDETDKEDLGEELSEGELEDNTFFAKLESTYAEENIFAADDLKDMIKEEKVMVERNEKGYYWCKQRDKKLYDDMMAAYAHTSPLRLSGK